MCASREKKSFAPKTIVPGYYERDDCMYKTSLDEKNKTGRTGSMADIVSDEKAELPDGEINSVTTSNIAGFEVLCDGKQTYVNGKLLNRMNDTYSKC